MDDALNRVVYKLCLSGEVAVMVSSDRRQRLVKS